MLATTPYGNGLALLIGGDNLIVKDGTPRLGQSIDAPVSAMLRFSASLGRWNAALWLRSTHDEKGIAFDVMSVGAFEMSPEHLSMVTIAQLVGDIKIDPHAIVGVVSGDQQLLNKFNRDVMDYLTRMIAEKCDVRALCTVVEAAIGAKPHVHVHIAIALPEPSASEMDLTFDVPMRHPPSEFPFMGGGP